MIVNLARRVGDVVVQERIGGDLLFEGGEAQEGVLVTFHHDGSELTGRVIHVAEAPPDDDPDAGPVVEVELVDDLTQDLGGERARANLPPSNDTDTNI
jgi:hypothetical protein